MLYPRLEPAPRTPVPRQLPLPFTPGPAPPPLPSDLAPLPPRQVWASLAPPLQAHMRLTLLRVIQEVLDDGGAVTPTEFP